MAKPQIKPPSPNRRRRPGAPRRRPSPARRACTRPRRCTASACARARTISTPCTSTACSCISAANPSRPQADRRALKTNAERRRPPIPTTASCWRCLSGTTRRSKAYERAIELKPDYAEAYNNRGNTLRALKRREEALAGFDRALPPAPDYPEALNNRGNALVELGRTRRGPGQLRPGAGARPDYADAQVNRGQCLVGNEARTTRRWRASTRRSQISRAMRWR